MIFGGLNLEKTPEYFINLENHNKFLINYGLEIKTVQIKELFCGFFTNKSLPFSKDDFFFFDNSLGICVLLWGSIFNKEEIEKENSFSNNFPFPKLLAYAFLKIGPDFVKLLNGDFALMVFNIFSSELYLFRDHIGIKPLGYLIEGNVICFSSDFLNLGRAFSKNEPIDLTTLLTKKIKTKYFLTPNKKVKKLLPGHYLKFSRGAVSVSKYWKPESLKINKKLDYLQILSELGALLKDSIKIRSDQKLIAASHLSGGIDSGIISVLVKEHYLNQENFYGFSWSPSEKNNIAYSLDDERFLVKLIAKKANLTPVFSDLDLKDYKKFSENYFFNLGNYWEEKVLENAKRKNINLIFSGWGGDEFFSAGKAGIDIDLVKSFKWKEFIAKNEVKGAVKLIKVFLNKVLFPLLGIPDWGTQKAFRNEKTYFKSHYKKDDKIVKKTFYKYNSRRKRQLGFIYYYHFAERCEQWALQGFRKGVIYRYPLLDKRIIEYVLQIPSRFFYRGNFGRIFARDLSKDLLPEEVRWSMSKYDTCLFKVMEKHIEEYSLSLIDEIHDWKKNPDLDIINLELLEKDILSLKKTTTWKDKDLLYRNLLTAKMLHEFTKTYRSLPEGLDNMEPGEVHDLNTDAADKNSKGPKSEV